MLVAGTAWLFAREELDGDARLPLRRRGGADVARRRARARHVRADARPARRPGAARAGDAGRSTPTRPGRPCSRTCSASARPCRRTWASSSTASWRMHPDVCRFISDAFYEDRLELGRGVRGAGRRRSGPGSAASRSSTRATRRRPRRRRPRSSAEIERLLGGTWTDSDGRHPTDRAERRDGRRALQRPGEAARPSGCQPGVAVGTVDKFQGQQAPVVFFSMASSSGRGRAARDRLPDVAEPAQRRRLAGAVPRLPRVRAGAARRRAARRSSTCASRTRSAASSSSPQICNARSVRILVGTAARRAPVPLRAEVH